MRTPPDWFAGGIEHIWLPYTQMKIAPLPQAAVATQGCRITLADGRELVDGIASWWSMCHGYNHPHIVQSVRKQLERMPHVMFGGLVHEQALTLARRLAVLTGMSRVFFADSGSVAVEVALKMALQYWQNKHVAGKHRFACFENGYHGDTLGAMSVSDPEHSLHKAFQHAVTQQHVLPIPKNAQDFAELDATLAKLKSSLAGVIIEPLVQGAGGMKFHSAETLSQIHRITKKHGLLFIADEIATGFYRTGNLFACNEAGITPDIMCLGKALTGGTMTLGATLASDEVYGSFLSDDPEGAFMHGPTFMANPMACAAANASLDLFEGSGVGDQGAAYNVRQNIKSIESQLSEELAACKQLPGVADVRVKGAIGVVQVVPEKIDYYGLRQQFIERGCWIRPFKDIIYLTPSFTISESELSTLSIAIREVLSR